MKVLNILSGGGAGGIEVLCLEYALNSKHENEYLILWHPGEISDEMNNNNIPVEIYQTSTKFYFRDYIRYIKKIKNDKPDVVLCHHTAPLTTLFLIGMRIVFPNIKLISYAHSNVEGWSKKEKFFSSLAFHISNRVIGISKSVCTSINKYFQTDSKLMCIYNGVDLSKFMSHDNLLHHLRNSYNDTLHIIYVGRLEKIKGVQNILIALSNVKEKIKFKFLIAGNGPYKNELEKMSSLLGIMDNVEFLGTRRDIPNLLGQSDVFIHMPECQEGFGITVVEAMAAGLICIVNDNGALPEIVDDNKNGFIINTKEELQLENILINIYKDWISDNVNEELLSIKRAAKKRAMDFDIKKYVNCLDDLIDKIVMETI